MMADEPSADVNAQPQQPPAEERAQPQAEPQQPQPAPANPPNNVPNVEFDQFLFNNNNNNNNNRNRAGGPNNLFTVRDRLFHAMYFKLAIMYSRTFPKPVQRTLEYFFLIKAIVFFFALVYIHTTFIKNPPKCLQHVQDWPRDGVLRVEVIPHLQKQRLEMSNALAYDKLIRDLHENYHYGIGPQTLDNHHLLKRYEAKLKKSGYVLRPTFVHSNNSTIYYFKTEAIAMPDAKVAKVVKPAEPVEEEMYIVEFSLEYGYLRLSAATRKRLQIPVRVVQLDPLTNQCFGDKLSKFILRDFLGYDDLLMASVRVIAEQEENKGYLRNVVTGEHYRFVSMWWSAWSSYPTAFFVMLLFTFSISMLLRFSHHQIFVFIVDLLQMLEFNVAARFPIAPLLTVILALVGMEAIMSEFFNDTTTAFYIILIVWIADQYDAICCHTRITKRHWLLFFYLYHFSFYAYHYRFSGQNSGLALISSWFFILHSMFYFFHRYELPVIVQQAQVLIVTRNQNAPPNAAAAILVNHLLRQARPGNNVAGGGLIGGIALPGDNQAAVGNPAAMDPQNQQQQQRTFIHNILQQHLRVDNRVANGGPLATLRRFIRSTGLMPPVRVRIQIGNIQRIGLATSENRAATNSNAQTSPNATTVGGAEGTSSSAGPPNDAARAPTGEATGTTSDSPNSSAGQAEETTTITPQILPTTNMNVKNSGVIEYPDVSASEDLNQAQATKSTANMEADTIVMKEDCELSATALPAETQNTAKATQERGNAMSVLPEEQQQQQQQQCHKSIDEMIEEDTVNKSNDIIVVGSSSSSSITLSSTANTTAVRQQEEKIESTAGTSQQTSNTTTAAAAAAATFGIQQLKHELQTPPQLLDDTISNDVVVGQAESVKVGQLEVTQNLAAASPTATHLAAPPTMMIDGAAVQRHDERVCPALTGTNTLAPSNVNTAITVATDNGEQSTTTGTNCN